jgi:radical SAM protein with 4Fe4S-binding SPASM domain
MLRVATRDMPFSLVSVDDDMVITLYGLNPEADEQPTLVIKGDKTKAFLSFAREFENLWFSNSKIALFEDPILKDYRKDWKTYIDLYNYDLKPGPPRQAIIFPTYACGQNCSYCMYKPARKMVDSEERNKEMEIETFERIISELIFFGVSRIELSGGGEPLEHTDFDKILQIIESIRSKNNEIHFGLLTNGLMIDRFDPKRMIYAFNDYIRISRCQEVNFNSQQTDPEIFVKWKNNIKSLLKEKRTNLSNNTKIGIKYLLTNSNYKEYTKFISDDLEDHALCEVDHFRFRSTRSVDLANAAKIEQEVFYIIEKAKLATNHPERISLSLGKVSYSKNFKCWISPMNVVIDPAGDVFICCNYLYDRNSKCIGNIHTDDFDSIWNSEKHRKIRSNIRRENCDRDNYCNCRYAELQSQLESLTAFV